MRLLALADIHNNRKVIGKLQMILEQKWDWILIAGDITNRGPASFAKELVEIALPENTLIVHGNMDTNEVIKVFEDKGVSVHCKKIVIGEYNVIGFGGSNYTPANTPTEYSEEEIEDGLNKLEIDSRTILITHAPPFNSGLDKVSSGLNVGSRAIRNIIDKKQPCLNICAHIHEQEGKRVINKTLVVKLGPAMHGRAVEINISKDINVSFFDL